MEEPRPRRASDDDSSIPVTPGSVGDEEKCLMSHFLHPPTRQTKSKCFVFSNLPFALAIASVLQIIFHIFSTNYLRKLLRFEPRKQHEIWRCITYMLVHDDWLHLVLNVIMQCLFALFLERRQGRIRVTLVYLLGGITGVLGASCFHPDLVIGASAGVYALLISNVADICLNFNSIKYKLCRIFCVGVIVLFDIIFNVAHFYSKDEPLISWVAHLVGGVTGLLMGLVLFKSNDDNNTKIRKFVNRTLFWSGLSLYMILMISLVILIIQIKKCTPSNIIRVQYIYVC